jgi:hypothetical protein
MNVILTDQSQALKVDAKPDTEHYDPESAEDQNDRSSELQKMFVTLETAWDESDTLITFEDVDGEEVFIRASEIILLSVPISDVEPAVGVAQDEDPEQINEIEKPNERPAPK